MFSELEKSFDAIRAVRDCPAVRRLCLDCWDVAMRLGEAEGLKFAAVLLEGVRAYQDHNRRLKAAGYGLTL